MTMPHTTRPTGLPALPAEHDIAGRITWLRERYMKTRATWPSTTFSPKSSRPHRMAR